MFYKLEFKPLMRADKNSENLFNPRSSVMKFTRVHP
jgi:hypothetical protein